MDDLEKIIGCLVYAMSSFVNYFKAIGRFTLELHSGNKQFGSKSAVICPAWPWNLTDDLKKNNRAHLLWQCKLYASFRSQLWIRAGVTVRKSPNWGNFFFTSVTFTFDLWPWPFALTLPLSMITSHENLIMTLRWEFQFQVLSYPKWVAT